MLDKRQAAVAAIELTSDLAVVQYCVSINVGLHVILAYTSVN